MNIPATICRRSQRGPEALEWLRMSERNQQETPSAMIFRDGHETGKIFVVDQAGILANGMPGVWLRLAPVS